MKREGYLRVTLSLLQKLILLLSLSIPIWSQNVPSPKKIDPAENLIQEMRENMARDRKMLEEYFNSGFLDKVDNFFKDSQLHLDQDPDYQRMLKDFKDSFEGMGSGIKTEWREVSRGRVFVIHAALENNGNFDLKIKNDQVTVSGSLKRKIGKYGNRSMSFKKSFPAPSNTDVNKVQVEPGDLKAHQGEVWIIFPWKKGQGPKVTPVPKSSGDKTI